MEETLKPDTKQYLCVKIIECMYSDNTSIKIKEALMKPLTHIFSWDESKNNILLNDNKYEINSENAYYNIKTESVSFKAKDKRVKSIIYF